MPLSHDQHLYETCPFIILISCVVFIPMLPNDDIVSESPSLISPERWVYLKVRPSFFEGVELFWVNYQYSSLSLPI